MGYGGIEFGNEEASLHEAFEGFDNAFGAEINASDFIAMKKTSKPQIFRGLEFLTVGGPTPTTAANGADGKTPLHNLLVAKEMIGPKVFMSKEICADFRESLLARVAYKGTIFFSTLPPKQEARKETEFSFRAEGSSRIRRAALIS